MNKGVISVLSSLVGAGVGAVATGKVMGDKANQWQQMSDKHLALYLMMNQWVKIKQEGKNLSEYFEKNKIEDLQAYLQKHVDDYNKGAVPYKKITQLRVRNEEFPKNTLRKIIRFKIDTTID